nr:proteinase inhibitor PSI-1.2-like [Ipomoea batatas]
MAATKASLLVTLMLLVHGSLVLGRSNPGGHANQQPKICPLVCMFSEYMICPPDETKIYDVGCTNCCFIEDTGCQLYSNGEPLCAQPRLHNYLKLNH